MSSKAWGRSLGFLCLLFIALTFVVGISISLRYLSVAAPANGMLQSDTSVFPIVAPVGANSPVVTTIPPLPPLVPTDEPSAPAVPPPVVQLLSCGADVEATCDVRGNLGPCSVIIQDPPGTDWLKDRWQAASDMGGTAIPGAHWVLLDFKKIINVQSIKLDWETAYAQDYVIYGRLNDYEEWKIIYDGGTDLERMGKGNRRTERTGQSPGVKAKMPLHVIHYLNWTSPDGRSNTASKSSMEGDSARNRELRFLKLYIRKPAVGWGVSLWQFDVYGTTFPS